MCVPRVVEASIEADVACCDSNLTAEPGTERLFVSAEQCDCDGFLIRYTRYVGLLVHCVRSIFKNIYIIYSFQIFRFLEKTSSNCIASDDFFQKVLLQGISFLISTVETYIRNEV